VREELRNAFARWGLPGCLRVDNGAPWGSWSDLPTDLALWIIGLGVGMHWNNRRSPQENGVVARSQGTSDRWCEPWTCKSPQELQARLDRMDHLYRETYPYRKGLSRMAFHPSLAHSGRPYDQVREWELWQWSRVAEHLSTYLGKRRVDGRGQVSLYTRNYFVSRLHCGKDVFVMYDPNRGEWVFADRDGRQLRSVPAECVSQKHVMDLNVSNRRQ
jgi:hypothetical protein